MKQFLQFFLLFLVLIPNSHAADKLYISTTETDESSEFVSSIFTTDINAQNPILIYKQSGFVRDLVIDIVNNKIYISTGHPFDADRTIKSAELSNTLSFSTIVPSLDLVVSLIIDKMRNILIYSMFGHGELYAYNLKNGKAKSVFVDNGIDTEAEVAFNFLNGDMLSFEHSTNRVFKSNFSKKSVKTFNLSNSESAIDAIIDNTRNKIIWSDGFSKIYESNLDGTGVKTIFDIEMAGIGFIGNMLLDATNNRILFNASKKLYSLSIDTNAAQLLGTFEGDVTGIAVYCEDCIALGSFKKNIKRLNGVIKKFIKKNCSQTIKTKQTKRLNKSYNKVIQATFSATVENLTKQSKKLLKFGRKTANLCESDQSQSLIKKLNSINKRALKTLEPIETDQLYCGGSI